jgi:hypothetical protein
MAKIAVHYPKHEERLHKLGSLESQVKCPCGPFTSREEMMIVHREFKSMEVRKWVKR